MIRTVDHRSMPVAGYPAPWCQAAGGEVTFHLSVAEPVRALRVVSLDGAAMATPWDVRQSGCGAENQKLLMGSFLFAAEADLGAVLPVHQVSLEILLVRRQQATLLRLGPLRLRCDGDVLCVSDDGADIIGPVRVPIGHWMAVTLRDDLGFARLEICGGERLAPIHFDVRSRHRWGGGGGDLVIGSGGKDEVSADARFAWPVLTGAGGTIGWRFPARLPPDLRVLSDGDARVPLAVVNLPTFSVRSSRWDGTAFDPRLAPEQYDAVHIHCDDMGAQDWPATHAVMIPKDAEPGVYALEVATAAGSERIPFFVRNRRSGVAVVVLLPTATYLAYLNEALPPDHFPWLTDDRGHRFARENGLLSLYDFHADHSGVCLASSRKPMATLRDDYLYPLCGCPHLLPVDLRLLRFLRDQGVVFDLITDHDLHGGGAAALGGYRVVMTGSHPEYVSVQMEAALAGHLAGGGRLAYLGGNGFAGTVAFRDDLMELRRGPSEVGRTWDGPLAEQSLCLTGEPGGFLRHRGRGEFALVGGAISLMGFAEGRPFRRTEASQDPAIGWLFEGVDRDVFGDYGTVLGAAAGYEVDATDPHLGSPSDTVVVARAEGFSDHYVADGARWYPGGETEAATRRVAEMTLRRLPGGGMIFSAASVAWCGALPDRGVMNDIGRITLNFLARASVPQDLENNLAPTPHQESKT